MSVLKIHLWLHRLLIQSGASLCVSSGWCPVKGGALEGGWRARGRQGREAARRVLWRLLGERRLETEL